MPRLPTSRLTKAKAPLLEGLANRARAPVGTLTRSLTFLERLRGSHQPASLHRPSPGTCSLEEKSLDVVAGPCLYSVMLVTHGTS